MKVQGNNNYMLLSGEEIVSDSFEIVEVFDGVGGEVQSKMIVKGGVNVDIGCGDAFGKGGGEEGEEAGDDGGKEAEEKVNNIVDAFKYAETQFGKGDYATYIKGYMKKIKTYLEEKNPARVPTFMKGAQEMVKFVLARFDDFQFYCPESYDMDNHIVLAYYKDGQAAPTFLYLMDGLRAEKV